MKTFILFILLYLVSARNVLAVDCPYGLVNDPFPGSCANYIDQNGDGFCDLSQDLSSVSTASTILSETVVRPSFRSVSYWYLFIPLSLYLIHWSLVGQSKRQKGWLSLVGFKYFWNLVILVLFVPGGIFGLLIGLGARTRFLINSHNNFGTSLVVILIFHLINHLRYYLKGFSLLRR